MKFDELARRLIMLEGDIRPKEVFWQHGTKEKKPEILSVVGTEPTGPIISGGNIYAKKLNQVIQNQQYTDEFLKGPIDSQALLQELMNEWLIGNTFIKSEHKKSLRGGGFIWDASSLRPSIKVRFDIDGANRTLIFRNVWWNYNEYLRQYTA